jgi:hypothetical protein
MLRLVLLVLLLVPCVLPALAGSYPWREAPVGAADRFESRIAPPVGFARVPVEPGSFAAWLRGLPMKPEGAPVMLYNGLPRFWSNSSYAVIDIDTGEKDLQQCADAIMRLRAEWLYAAGRKNEIGFDYTNGARVDFSRWAQGLRPRESGRTVRWARRAKPDAGYASFRKYLEQIFSYAGTYSLARELKPVKAGEMAIGDVFIQGGFPGHALLVADMAENAATGERRVLLVQSYMPAQDMHVLRNEAAGGSPWYPADFGDELSTPDWAKPFTAADLKRWP